MPRATPVVATRQFVESEEEIKHPKSRVQKSTGPALESLEAPSIVTSERKVSPEKAANLKFAEDVLTVRLSEQANETDEPFATVINDGIRVDIPRGQEVQVKRKFVEILARAKITRYTQRKLPDNGGYENVPHNVSKFPFTIIEDPAGDKGRQYMKAILGEV